MRRSSSVRAEIETVLRRKIPGALSPQVRIEGIRLTSGIEVVSTATDGGFSVGALTEVGGGPSSGKATLALSLMAQCSVHGMILAWIDVADSLDPGCAAMAGVDLRRMLWVRCGNRRRKQDPREKVNKASLSTGILIDRTITTPSLSGGGGSPHPRNEGRGLPEAIGGFMGGLAAELMRMEARGTVKSQPGGNQALLPVKRKDRSIGTPGAPNRAAGSKANQAVTLQPFPARSKDREEQVATDRLPARRGDLALSRQTGTWEPRCAEAGSGRRRTDGTCEKLEEIRLAAASPWGSAKVSPNRFTSVDKTSFRSSAEPCGPTKKDRIRSSFEVTREKFDANPMEGTNAEAVTKAKPTTEEIEGASGTERAKATATKMAGVLPFVQDGSGGKGKRKFPHVRQVESDQEPHVRGIPKRKDQSWSAIDKALRATDMLLQAGGFGVIVLDLGGIAPEAVWRIPMATWFRFRAAADRSRVCLVVLTQYSCVRSSADLVLEMETGEMQASGQVMTGVKYGVQVARQRFAGTTVANWKAAQFPETNQGKKAASSDPSISRLSCLEDRWESGPETVAGTIREQASVAGKRRPAQPERTGVWHGTAAWVQTSDVVGVRAKTGERRVRERPGRTG